MLDVVTLNDKYIRNIIDESNQLFEKFNLNKDIIPVALDIIIKYVKKSIPSEPREKEILYLAAYFISIRHPFFISILCNKRELQRSIQYKNN